MTLDERASTLWTDVGGAPGVFKDRDMPIIKRHLREAVAQTLEEASIAMKKAAEMENFEGRGLDPLDWLRARAAAIREGKT